MPIRNVADWLTENYGGNYRSGRAQRKPRACDEIIDGRRCGIEIEVENSRHYDLVHWHSTDDGSLREGGVEFITRGTGLGGRDLLEAINELDQVLSSSDSSGGWRTSTHVHVDVRDMTPPVLRKFLMGVILYEEVLFKIAGPERFHNTFCIPFEVAQEQVLELSRAFAQPGYRMLSGIQWEKYSALNLNALFRFGTVEFRLSESKFNRQDLIRLVNRFLTFSALAEEHADMDENEYLDFLHSQPMEEVLRNSWPRVTNINRQMLDCGYDNVKDIINLHTALAAASRTESGEEEAPVEATSSPEWMAAAMRRVHVPDRPRRTPRPESPRAEAMERAQGGTAGSASMTFSELLQAAEQLRQEASRSSGAGLSGRTGRGGAASADTDSPF